MLKVHPFRLLLSTLPDLVRDNKSKPKFLHQNVCLNSPHRKFAQTHSYAGNCQLAPIHHIPYLFLLNIYLTQIISVQVQSHFVPIHIPSEKISLVPLLHTSLWVILVPTQLITNNFMYTHPSPIYRSVLIYSFLYVSGGKFPTIRWELSLLCHSRLIVTPPNN